MTEILPARQGRGFWLRRGAHLKVINTHGTQVVDAWALATPDLDERMSMPHTRATLGSLRLRAGDQLYSERRRPILTLTEDTSPGIHDMLVPACDMYRYEQLGHKGHHDNCCDNFRAALAELGYEPVPVPCPLNLFMNAFTTGDSLELRQSVSSPDDHVVLRAERDLIAILSTCPQDMVPINGPAMKPADVQVEVR